MPSATSRSTGFGSDGGWNLRAASRVGRSATYERELRKARDLAIGELSQNAADLGANAVVGIDLDYETVGGQGSMLMVTVSGTAVVVE